MKNIIDSHNKRILKNLNKKKTTLPCNCRKECPIKNGQCRTESVIYCAEIRDASYIGLTSGQIKDRITSHRQTFREKEKQNSTTLSKFIWSNNLNRDDTGNLIEPSIKWSILQQSDTYKPGQKHCNLCLNEKLFIISNINKPNNINKRTDVATICIHKHKHYLNSVTWSPRGCVMTQPFTHTRSLEHTTAELNSGTWIRTSQQHTFSLRQRP